MGERPLDLPIGALAQGPQAGDSYLSAARRLDVERPAEIRLEEILYDVQSQVRRAEAAFPDLRAPRATRR